MITGDVVATMLPIMDNLEKAADAKTDDKAYIVEATWDYTDPEFSKYQKGFYWTNENIACYLNMFNVQGMD